MSPQDPLYNMHATSVPGLFNNSTNTNVHIPSEFSSEFDPQKLSQASGGKLNGLTNLGNNDLSRERFTNFPNTNRPRHSNSQSLLNSTAPSFREPGSYFPSSSNDIYSNAMMSPTSAHMQPHDPRMGFEFGRAQLGAGHKNFSDAFNGSVGVMPSHQGAGKSGFSQPQGGHSAYPSATPFINGMHSQTPYGPHVPTGISQSASNPAGTSSGTANYSSNKDNNNQEEISTIFVVGFPEDMQEREFQNMFTFSPGFEAATLKIPNKEYTAYNGIGPGRGFQNYNGPSDPYNLMTINSGGVLVDGGREGGMSSWPASAPGEEGNPHFMPGIAPPRKQIIGFAKFRSREAALEARDVLQGRRIDIEKGAVLKAEMAKKNLHTKRGVGPLPNSGAAVNGNNMAVNNPPPPPINHAGPAGLGLGYNLNGVLGAHPTSLTGDNFNIPPAEPYFPREREPLPSIGRLRWGDSMQSEVSPVGNVNLSHLTSPTRERDEDERRLEGTLTAIGFGMTRGPRERAAEEEKRKELRLRGNNAAAYDAFHSVPATGPPGLSRQASNLNGASLLPPEADNGPGSSLGSSPHLSNGYAIPFSTSQMTHGLNLDEVVGPWDKINRAVPVRPTSGSQRSSSPSLPASTTSQAEAQLSSSPNHQTPKNDDIQMSLRQFPTEDTSVSGGNVIQSPEGVQADLIQQIDSLALNTADGNTSPQLPSPASGASSGSTRNAVDQNPPINTLYVGNLPTSPPPIGMPQDYLEESLRELFRNQPGYRRLCFRQKHNGPMCFVEFEDVSFATRAMSDLHGNTLKGLVKGGGIRLSYSKNPLGVRTPTSATSGGPALQQQQLQNMQAVLGAEADLSSQQHRTILRRDEQNQSGNTYNNFIASPPPRFLPLAQSSAGFFGPSSPPATLTNNNFMRPTNGGLNTFSYNLAAANGIGSTSISPTPFSPFGLKDQHDIPNQSTASEEALHPQQ
ncbi:hypothetical protein P691DRAFT_788207 [Macrolepiota fuliginosa MF-IS2]|uniref:RRM domain-containing protein n=1 Tax=Macrolepiota fuliginosa MF-IS2 TaxID=1400762 RepID=A0A9P5XJM3_9AGAR|nr:hypothetical protein P691DRAFT_788207 [Macrolepiota fuliginosa MF-IS2]